ncbi:MAG: hypothetical protein J1F60_02155 [Oscillospiraceae bacterium]|nr:hypothetical protein [Oscillospiraceae bacterium]
MEDKLSALLQILNPDNTMSVNRFLAHSIGMADTIIYSALISKYTYYRNCGKLSDGGWFYSTIEDLQESTTYGVKTQRTVIKHLSELGLIESKLMGMPARRYFRLKSNTEILEALIAKGQAICDEMRMKSEIDSDNENSQEEHRNTSLSQKDKQDCPVGQTRLSQKDKLDYPERTNKFDPSGQSYINLNINNLKGNQSINLGDGQIEKQNFCDILSAIGYNSTRCGYKFILKPPESEADFAEYDEADRGIQGCAIPYTLGYDNKAMEIALRFLFGYSYYSAHDTSEERIAFVDVVIEFLAEMACAEKTKIKDGYISGKLVIDKINHLIQTASLSDCLWGFKDKWETIVSETKIKNPRSYMKSTLWNWLIDYKLEDFCYAF